MQRLRQLDGKLEKLNKLETLTDHGER